jgi:two-component system vancomycin resistance associated response regulator VraR
MMPQTTSYIRVLVVDDHELTRFALKLALKRQSHIEVVATAGNGREALRQTKKYQPDLIVLDLNMPIMDGWTFSKRVKQDYPYVKIVAYSSVEGGKEQIMADGAVIDAYCEKAESTEKLLDVIEAIA